MSLIAIGAYLKRLRKLNRLTQDELAQRLGLSGNTIYRIESDQQEPRGGNLVALLQELKGHQDDIDILDSMKQDEENAGKKRAEERFGQADISEIDYIIDETTDEEFSNLLDEFRREFHRDQDIMSDLRVFLAGWRAGRGGARRRTG